MDNTCVSECVCLCVCVCVCKSSLRWVCILPFMFSVSLYVYSTCLCVRVRHFPNLWLAGAGDNYAPPISSAVWLTVQLHWLSALTQAVWRFGSPCPMAALLLCDLSKPDWWNTFGRAYQEAWPTRWAEGRHLGERVSSWWPTARIKQPKVPKCDLVIIRNYLNLIIALGQNGHVH